VEDSPQKVGHDKLVYRIAVGSIMVDLLALLGLDEFAKLSYPLVNS
jgi:hypothetical protein